MRTIPVAVEDDLLPMLAEENALPGESIHRLVVFELFRRGRLSSSRGAQLLALSRVDFIRAASDLGIPYLDLSPDEWTEEVAAANKLAAVVGSCL